MKYVLDVNVALKWEPKYPTPRKTPLPFHDESMRIRPLLLAPMVRRSWVYFNGAQVILEEKRELLRSRRHGVHSGVRSTWTGTNRYPLPSQSFRARFKSR